jgi:hypothetical protein
MDGLRAKFMQPVSHTLRRKHCQTDRWIGRTGIRPEILRRDELHVMAQLPELISRVPERTHNAVDLR